MTALPNASDFKHVPAMSPDSVMIRPDVKEFYWGYEVASNEQVVSSAVLMCWLYRFLTIAMITAAFGVWLMPAMAFVGSVLIAKSVAFVVLLCGAAMLARPAMRGTRVRVQIDTANGELREVVVGLFGAVVEHGRYGLDSVQGVKIVSSRAEPSFGQIQVRIHGLGAIPVGDGSLAALRPLRDRLANDCGVEHRDNLRPVIWGGPLAA